MVEMQWRNEVISSIFLVRANGLRLRKVHGDKHCTTAGRAVIRTKVVRIRRKSIRPERKPFLIGMAEYAQCAYYANNLTVGFV